MIDVKCEIPVYEIDGKDVDLEDNKLAMENHSIYDDRIRLKVAGKFYTLLAKDLKSAIGNCTNSAKY